MLPFLLVILIYEITRFPRISRHFKCNLQILKEQSMKFAVFLLTVITVASCFSIGNITQFKISSYLLPNKTLPMELSIVSPTVKGSYPVILFLTGLSGLTPKHPHSQLCNALAADGFIVIVLSKLELATPKTVTSAFSRAVDWINSNFQDSLNRHISNIVADIENRLILLSHSSAGHIETQYLNTTCNNVKVQIMLDPVDGADPYGFVDDFITHPGQLLPYEIPVLVVESALSAVRALPGELPCAPNLLSNMRFYNAMRGPKWYVNISDYGHADFYDDYYRIAGSGLCKTCSHNCNFKAYRHLMKDLISNFAKGILQKDSQKLKWIEKGQFEVSAEVKYSYQGFNPLDGGFCRRAIKSILQQ